MIVVNPVYRARFHTKTRPGPQQAHMDSPCLLWTAGKNRKGYGHFYAGVMTTAHRYAYILAHGPIEGGLHVLHKCDVKACVNPDHLYLGTNDDNIRDRAERIGFDAVQRWDAWHASHDGRMAKGDRWQESHAGKAPKGEAHHLTKITEDDVRAIRVAYIPRKNGGLDALAAKYGVDRTTIHNIVVGKTWGHVL